MRGAWGINIGMAHRGEALVLMGLLNLIMLTIIGQMSSHTDSSRLASFILSRREWGASNVLNSFGDVCFFASAKVVELYGFYSQFFSTLPLSSFERVHGEQATYSCLLPL